MRACLKSKTAGFYENSKGEYGSKEDGWGEIEGIVGEYGGKGDSWGEIEGIVRHNEAIEKFEKSLNSPQSAIK